MARVRSLNVADRPWLLAVGATRVGPWGDLPPLAVVIGLALAAAGVWSLRRQLSPLAIEPATLMLLAWLGGYAVAIFAGLGLSYPRYFLPACLLLLPLMGAGLGYVLSLAVAQSRGLKSTSTIGRRAATR